MNIKHKLRNQYRRRNSGTQYRNILQIIHIDLPLLLLLISLTCAGFFILYSAGNENFSLVQRQIFHIGLAFLVMFVFAQIPPETYKRYSMWFYLFFLLLLIYVLVLGHINKGAQRWIHLGPFNLQPSELLKIAIPMFVAARFSSISLPPRMKDLSIASLIIIVPVLLTAKQPDLGTAILLAIAGFSVLFLAGLPFRLIAILAIIALIAAPLLWHHMHDYQQQRVLTFLNPEADPLGKGYHIIQSKIAIGSGGIFGKGWLLGTQAHLHFLPENTTDFIFGVWGEEFGFVGSIGVILLYFIILLRAFYIAVEAQDTFTRLLAGSLTLTFFFSFFINMGMVTGILPVVGIPLPLISYGGTSMVTMLANFGILMSIHTHRKLLRT